jgi:hypothetical protein
MIAFTKPKYLLFFWRKFNESTLFISQKISTKFIYPHMYKKITLISWTFPKNILAISFVSYVELNSLFEPRHDKTNIVRLLPAWIQTSLRIRAV